DPYLVGYYVHNNPEAAEIDVQDLRSHLSKTLPEYMVPNSFMKLEEIPLTVSGKANRRALPEPEVSRGVEYVAPETEEEKVMAAIWSEILLLEEVGTMDNFFNSGGDSIKAIRLIYEVKERLAVTLDLSDLYNHQTLGELAAVLTEKQGQVDEAYEKAVAEVESFSDRYKETVGVDSTVEAVYPMSGVEKGMVFYTMLADEDEQDFHKILYHEQNVYPIRWANFDFNVFTKAVKLMMKKHEELRKIFDVDNFAHIIKKEMEPELYHWDIRHLDEEAQSQYILDKIDEERIKSTDFSGDVPLWRMNLVQIKDSLRYIIFDMHHAVMDGWSLHAFLAELNDFCIHISLDPEFQPEMLRSGYRDHIVGELRDTYNESSKAYWREELMDYNRFEFTPTGAEHEYVTKFYELGPELKSDLEELATKLGTSLKNLVFAAYLYTFRTLGGFDDFVTGFTANNRPLVPDGDKILGCFLNVVPYRAQMPTEGTWRDYIKTISQRLVGLKEHERIPLKEIVDIVDETTTDQNPFFDIAFNFIDFWIIHERMEHYADTDTEDLDFGHDNRDVNQNTLLDFHVKATDDLLIHLEYSTTIVNAELADRLCEYFEQILKQFTIDVDGKVGSTSIISEEEKSRILNDFNATSTVY
ncbi:MAG: condensation domain-containing protein, partial [Cyclobacteriaceae bacterium]